MQSESIVIGLMSGTSLDGIDASIVKIIESENGLNLEPVHFSTLSFSDGVKKKLLNLCNPEKARIEEISAMNMLMGELFAEASMKAIAEAGLTRDDILLISSHGQTIFHQPNAIIVDEREITSTMQIGDIGVIAERTGIMTVGDFRTRDMAVGGQGAPLVPYADYLFFRDEKVGRVLLNIGGISNITVIPPNCREEDVVAYDTGPGNMMIDAFTEWATNGKQTFDKDGAIAARGIVNESWLSELLKHPYFKQTAPKSTGREQFGIDYARKLWNEAELAGITNSDKIATITALTAKTIAMEILKHKDVGEVLVSGGGRYNPTLMRNISDFLPSEIKVNGTEASDFPADAKEAITFALLGYQCYRKRTNNLPSATGADKPVVMGKIAW
ncbi:anhydro-N-acetylmuramic acid kinase [Ornithinibacillus halophilus]|uniref:Anhydro-N-acetylmuramic acid kinase n=1 Tax=Ornithinibacillus halophilus TaxID=930117 RepID=A0A1M5K1J6_9BACI|nr:anhydro-N-acetylmuramic acid kinase [Ornithinibacillus halophilus]SHG46658.1 anhydro-N-acetylmuramic acid kinase [Ornithinibacillus halophilus]